MADRRQPLFVMAPSPVEPMDRLAAHLGVQARLLIKRDDTLPVGFGGNKVRKLAFVGAEAVAQGADTLITCGGVQSNHARVTAAVAARLGMRCLLVANGEPQAVATGNARLAAIYGAEIHYVASRDERAPRMDALADDLVRHGRTPFVIPLGASVPLGAYAFDVAIDELLGQLDAPPDVIVVSTSSGGTQAGLAAGCLRRGIPTRVVGISADDAATAIGATVTPLLAGLDTLWHDRLDRAANARVDVDDTQVGAGYGIPTDASSEAASLFARLEGLILDPTYTAKAAAGLIAMLRGQGREAGTILFWHTGGLPGVFV
jgi:1-aminocyclopropane-1-carboxylate deaminase/D-cysteine desulfhydrase-like pyridoxal-dependent ACC family enzyme